MQKAIPALCLFFSFLSFSSLFAQTAGVQIIHNCADPAADTIDMYVNGVILDSNFAYKSATPFTAFGSGVTFNIGFAHHHSISVADTFKSFSIGPLNSGENDVFILSGVVGSGFAANPDGRSTSLALNEIAAVKTTDTTGNVSFLFYNGATDEPGLNVIVTADWLMEHGAKYGDVLPYQQVYFAAYEWDVYNQDSTINMGKWIADFRFVGGQTAVVIASGFADPDSNNGGPELNLYAVFASGTVIQLIPENAYFQFLHNCADPSVDSMDVYINGKKKYANLPFRSGTPALTVKANVPFSYALAPKNSASVGSAFWTKTDTLGIDTFYVNTASGLRGSGFAPNPSGRSTAFEVLEKVPAKIHSSSNGNFDFFFIDGVTDAPPLNVQLSGGPDILVKQAYSDQSNYFSLIPTDYILQVQDTAGNNSYPYYVAPFSGFESQSGVILASGFMYPANNNNGAGFGLFLSTAKGGPFMQLSTNTAINKVSDAFGISLFPNPATDYLQISFETSGNERTEVQVIDTKGQTMGNLRNASNIEGRQNIIASLNQVSAGIYFVRVTEGQNISYRRFVVVK
ncbi:MAG: hypothetical protein JWO06_3482 [Bacteroidota bacterium]|nr:hypothetical protein [Bacteroidota bacterium]